MPLQKIQIYIALMFALFPGYVFASNFPRMAYTLREEEKYVNHFKYARNYTQCFVCNYSFREHFQWVQKKFFVEGIGEFDSSKNAASAYVSKILGEGLERMHRWQTSTLRLNKDFNPKIRVQCRHGCGMEFP